MTYGVYCLVNKINHKRYIGQSTSVERRVRLIFSRVSRGEWGNKEFCCDVVKYGKENFEVELLFVIQKIDSDSKELLWLHEEYFIHKFDTTNPDKGYNISTGGNGPNGVVASELTRDKMRRTKLGTCHTEETKEKLRAAMVRRKGEFSPMYGKHHSEETKIKISASLRKRSKM